MQRDRRKPNYPGHWESGASGSMVKGESFLQGAIRELRERLWAFVAARTKS